MAYKMFFDSELMPITPSKVQLKIKNQNKTLNLIDGTQINTLKTAGLSEISFELLLPQSPYPFAVDAQPAEYYLNLFEQLKISEKEFQWILYRSKPNGDLLFHTNLTVSLEDYQITDDVAEGFDIEVKINLKQFLPFGTKTVTIAQPTATKAATATVDTQKRETNNAPKTTSYTVVSGDCLWNIAKKYLGDGSRYTEIYELNKDKIKNPNLIYAGQVLTMP